MFSDKTLIATIEKISSSIVPAWLHQEVPVIQHTTEEAEASREEHHVVQEAQPTQEELAQDCHLQS